MLLFCLSAVWAAEVDASGTIVIGWAEYGELWSGDLLLGGFDLRSPPSPADRLLISPSARISARLSPKHRLRLAPNLRTLQRTTGLDDELALVHGLASDGLPVEQAWRERAFLDEASWRWRPHGDRAIELSAGILPYAISGGRFQVESWPGARLRIDGTRLGTVGLTGDLRLAISPQGTRQLALSILREPSRFEFLGVEAAWVHDPTQGLAPILSSDLGLQLDVVGATASDFLQQNGDAFFSRLGQIYGDQADGVQLLQADLNDYMDLRGSTDLVYLFAGGRGLSGDWSLDAGLTTLLGRGTVAGDTFSDGDWASVDSAVWPQTAPRAPFEASIRFRALAFDLALSRQLGEQLTVDSFVQGLSGGGDLVGKAAEGRPISTFLASDQAFMRTRLFPTRPFAASGQWTLPPGVSTHGLVSLGLGGSLHGDHGSLRLQAAALAAPVRSPLPPHGRWYGAELDGLGALRLRQGVTLLGEADVFQPGPFFVDASDPAADRPGELPRGWRLAASVEFRGARP